MAVLGPFVASLCWMATTHLETKNVCKYFAVHDLKFWGRPLPNSMVTCGHSLLQFCSRSKGFNLVFEPWAHTKWKGRWQWQEWHSMTCQVIFSSLLATNVWKMFWVHVTVLAPFFDFGSTYLLLVILGDKYHARWIFVLTWYTTCYLVVGSRPSFSIFPRFGSVSQGKIGKKKKCYQSSNIFNFFFTILPCTICNNQTSIKQLQSCKRKSRWKREKKNPWYLIISYNTKRDEASIKIILRKENKC